MSSLPIVNVLLAAFNGEKWIREQIDSIINQKNVDVNIYVSIDLSVDSTMRICEEIKCDYKKIYILPYGEKFGAAAPNFFRLILQVDNTDADYWAFSDQDDIWMPNKLYEAIKVMNANKANCYSSDLSIWNGDRVEGVLKKSFPQKKIDYLFQGASAGCTYVLDKKSFYFVKKKINDNTKSIWSGFSHDWLIYAITRSYGFKWVIDKSANILYRQHAQNQQGARVGLSGLYKKIGYINNGWYGRHIRKMRPFLSNNQQEINIFNMLEGRALMGKIKCLGYMFSFRRRMIENFLVIYKIMTNKI